MEGLLPLASDRNWSFNYCVLRENARIYPIYRSYNIRRNIQARGCFSQTFLVRRFVKAIGFAFIGTKEREDPFDPLLIVNFLDVRFAVVRDIQLFGEMAFNNISWHMHPQGMRS